MALNDTCAISLQLCVARANSVRKIDVVYYLQSRLLDCTDEGRAGLRSGKSVVNYIKLVSRIGRTLLTTTDKDIVLSTRRPVDDVSNNI